MISPARKAPTPLCGTLRASSGSYESLYLIVHGPCADGFGVAVRLPAEREPNFEFSYIGALCTFTERIA